MTAPTPLHRKDKAEAQDAAPDQDDANVLAVRPQGGGATNTPHAQQARIATFAAAARAGMKPVQSDAEPVEPRAPAPAEPLQRDKPWGAGEALVRAGRLDAQSLRKIVEAHDRTGASFIDVSARLGLVGKADLNVALAIERGFLRPDALGEAIPPALVSVHKPNSSSAEHFRSVRTRLLTMRDPERLTRFAVVSLARRREADYFALNLAAALAELGRTVLLVDVDLRAQRLERLFGLEPGPAMRDVLRDLAPPMAAVRETLISRLDVAPAGRAGADAQEALARPALLEAFEEYERRYDSVIALSTPFSSATDGRFVWAACGAALVAVRQHHDRADDLRKLHQALRQVGAETLGAVLVK